MGPLDGTVITEETEGLWCTKGMMSREFTGHVHVGEVVCRQCGIDAKTCAFGIHKNAGSQLRSRLFFGRVEACLGADVDCDVGVKRLVIPGYDFILHRIHTVFSPCMPGLSQHVKPA